MRKQGLQEGLWQRRTSEATARWASSVVSGAVSPLTPALSPLRGEGDAMGALGLTGRINRERTPLMAGEPRRTTMSCFA